MDIAKWFNEQKIKPVQDRKDGMDYWKNYELFTWNDVIECLEAMKDLCDGKKSDTGEKQCNLPVVRRFAFKEVFDKWYNTKDDAELGNWLFAKYKGITP